MRYLLRPFQVLYSIYAILVFLALMVILLPFVLLAGAFRETTRGDIIYYIVTFWSDVGMALWGMPHKTMGLNDYAPSHPVIFVFNHGSYLDIPILLKSVRKFRVRVLGKAEMAKIPLFGLFYRGAVIMVDRSNAEARAKSVAKLKSSLDKNISVVIAPEGTFNMTHKPLKEFYDGAFRIAIETQTPIKPMLILDAYDRLHPNSIFSFTPGGSRTVFLEEISVAGYGPERIAELKQIVYSTMENALISFNASWIKDDGRE